MAILMTAPWIANEFPYDDIRYNTSKTNYSTWRSTIITVKEYSRRTEEKHAAYFTGWFQEIGLEIFGLARLSL